MRAVSMLLGVALAITAYVVLGLLLSGWLTAVIAAALLILFGVGGSSSRRSM